MIMLLVNGRVETLLCLLQCHKHNHSLIIMNSMDWLNGVKIELKSKVKGRKLYFPLRQKDKRWYYILIHLNIWDEKLKVFGAQAGWKAICLSSRVETWGQQRTCGIDSMNNGRCAGWLHIHSQTHTVLRGIEHFPAFWYPRILVKIQCGFLYQYLAA